MQVDRLTQKSKPSGPRGPRPQGGRPQGGQRGGFGGQRGGGFGNRGGPRGGFRGRGRWSIIKLNVCILL